MGERKVLNKYIPPDFDPRLVPRSKRPKDDLVPVRMMLPFSIQCTTCSSFMYRGRKFNSKKEPMGGAEGTYLGITRFRFYIKCTVCSRPITFLTDPKNSDYEMESGATRNYEIWQDRERTEEEGEREREEGEKNDPMRALENRVLDSQREMADLDNLDEIKAMNMKHLQMMSGGMGTVPGFDAGVKAVLSARQKEDTGVKEEEELNEHGLTKEEEELVKQIKFKKNANNNNNTVPQIQRLGEDDEKRLDTQRQAYESQMEQQQDELLKNNTTAPAHIKKSIMPIVRVKRKIATVNETTKTTKRQMVTTESFLKKGSVTDDDDDDGDSGGGDMLGGLLGAYASDSD